MMRSLRTFVGILAAATLALTAPHMAAAPADSWQGRLTTTRNPACAVLTTAEIQAATGFPGYNDATPGDSPGEGIGGGASCQFSAPLFAIDGRGKAMKAPKGPLVSLVLIEGKNYTRTRAIGRGCTREAVAGVGDEAYFEVCPSDVKLKRTPGLYVRAGVKDLIVQMDVEPPDTDASIRPKVIAVAKAAAAKIR